MKTNCSSQLDRALEPLDVDGMARRSGFRRRQPKKLSPLTFIRSCCLLLINKKVSLRRWAILIGTLINQTYAKQSLFERMSHSAATFLQSVVLALVGKLSLGVQRVLPPVLDSFSRVLLQDSVILTLPAKLRRFFPGARNQHGHLGGMLRVQGLYDLKGACFVSFSHGPFTTNDCELADEVLKLLRPGDLLLRDLGYLVLGVFRRIDQMQAFFLSRFKHNLQVFEPDGQGLDLPKLLSHRTHPLDQDVLVGAKEQLPVRLVALRVSEEVANQRRHQARQNRHFRASKRHLQLLSWDLLMTNVSQERLPTRAVAKVYGLRFHIETIFKAWKSHFSLEDIPAGSRAQVETLLYARLLLITVFEVCFFSRWDYENQERCGPLSLLKTAAFLQLYLPLTLLSELQSRLEDALQKQVPYHCTYEKGRRRKNFVEKLELT
jgi:hypothetical protein